MSLASERDCSPLLLAGIVVLAAALRIGYACTLSDEPKYADSHQYLAMAAHVLAGNGPMINDERRAFREPTLPVTLAALEWSGIATSRRAQRVALATIAALLPFALWLLARALGLPSRAALLAALGAAVWPHQVYFAPLFLGEGLSSLVLVIAMTALSRLRLAGGAGAALVAGVLLALAILARFSLGLVPLALLVLWPWLAPSGRRRLFVLVLAGYALAMAPWWLRNARLFGRFVPHSTHMGLHAWESLGPEATGAPVADHIEIPPRGDLSETEWDAMLQRAAFAHVARDPWHAVALVPVKVARLWSPVPNDAGHRSAANVAISLASVVPLYALALVGAWRARSRLLRDLWPLWLVPTYLTLVHATISFGSVRYRLPAEPFLIVLAAIGLGGPSSPPPPNQQR